MRRLRQCKSARDKYGAAEAIKRIYREYDKNNFFIRFKQRGLHDPDEPAAEGAGGKDRGTNRMNRQLFLSQPHLKFKVDADLAMSVIYSLIMNIKNRDVLPRNHVEVFDFMVDHLVESLFE